MLQLFLIDRLVFSTYFRSSVSAINVMVLLYVQFISTTISCVIIKSKLVLTSICDMFGIWCLALHGHFIRKVCVCTMTKSSSVFFHSKDQILTPFYAEDLVLCQCSFHLVCHDTGAQPHTLSVRAVSAMYTNNLLAGIILVPCMSKVSSFISSIVA